MIDLEFQGDRRWCSRRSIELDVELISTDNVLSIAKMTDISEEGCMVQTFSRCDLTNDLYTIKLPGQDELEGYVIWTADGCAGFAFTSPLHPVSVQSLVMKSLYAKLNRHLAQKPGSRRPLQNKKS